jgi:ribosomal protein S18 acetylase RimI-like enzyme
VRVIPLDEDSISQHLKQLVALDQYFIKKYGSDFTTFEWNEENFTYPVPGKWKHSFLAFCDTKNEVIGYWIASHSVAGVCHTHRVAVSDEFQGKNIGKLLFDAVNDSAKENIFAFTVEAARNNTKAINFYEGLGFRVVDDSKTVKDYLSSRGREARVIEGVIKENDDSEYHMLFLKK